MELSAFQLLLATVFFLGVLTTSSSVKRQYHLITDQKSWADAQAYCRDHYADLATIENGLDVSQIQREAQRLGFMSEAWVGLYNDINSWRCSHDEVPLRWKKWGQNMPSNALGKDECVGIFQDGGWCDLSCLISYPFICYDEKKAGSGKFVYYSALKTWKDAQAYCRQSHTDLACPTSDTENSILKNMFSVGWTWIGFYRDDWKWSDKTNISALRWAPFEPNNFGGDENCGFLISSVFNGGTNGWFDDAECSGPRAFFCQTLPEEKKVVRLVLQSDQDMNDPTVKAALLEKMQQMLVKQGMMVNTTLRWREQSDGTVFFKQEEKQSENVENDTVTTCEL